MGSKIQIASHYGSAAYLVTPVLANTTTVPAEPTTCPVDIALTFLRGSDDIWLPSPMAYMLPLTYEHAALLVEQLDVIGSPFRPQLKDLRARCITWLKTNATPTSKIEPKFVPSNDHPRFSTWLTLTPRRPMELPAPEALHAASVRPDQVVEVLLNHRTPSDVLAPLSRLSNPRALLSGPERKNFSRPKGFGRSRSGKHSIELSGVTSQVSALMVRCDSVAKRTLLAKIIADWDVIARPRVIWDQEEHLYIVSSKFRPAQHSYTQSTAANPTIELAGVISPEIPHTPLVIHWASAPQYPMCDLSARNPYYDGESPNASEIASKLLNFLTPAQHVRFDHYPKLLSFREERRSLRGLFMKGLLLHYQMCHAFRLGIVPVLQGLDPNQVVVVANPITPEAIAHLLQQALEQEMVHLAPLEVNSGISRVIVHMLATAGPVLVMPEEENISVIDSCAFPEVPPYIVQTAGGGPVPPFVEALHCPLLQK